MAKGTFNAVQKNKRKMIIDAVRAAQDKGLDYEGVQQFANENFQTPKHLLKKALDGFKQTKPVILPEPVELDDEPVVANEQAEE